MSQKAFFLEFLPIGSLKPRANLITFYLRAIWIVEDSGYFLYGVVSSPVKTLPLCQSPPEITAGLFYTTAVLLSACLVFPAVGSRAEGDAPTSPKGNKSLPPTLVIFLFFCSWPCVLHMLQALCYFRLWKYSWILIPSFTADLSLKVLRLRSSYMKRNLLFLQLSMNSPNP